MIDIHNHIIFGVDDGAETIEQSMEMLKAAEKAGVTKICFTPHYMEDGYHTPKAVLLERMKRLQEMIHQENIAIEVFLGEEIFIFPSLGKSLDEVISLNDSRYILVELPLFEEISFVDDVLYELLAMGKTPIIAHPERYYCLAKDFSFAEKLVGKGILLQMNINSLVGHYGKEAKRLAMQLLQHNLISFVGSDAHSPSGYHSLKESLSVLTKLAGEEKMKELTESNPEKVLLDKEIEPCCIESEGKIQKIGLWDKLMRKVR